MNFKTLLSGLVLTFCVGATHAATLNTDMVHSNSTKLAPFGIAKTEIYIDNDSKELIWVLVAGSQEMLMSGFSLRLYNDEEEIEKVRIKMAKSPISDAFFNQLVSNHTRLKVSNYLPKE